MNRITVDVIQDVRYTARLARKSPGFSVCVVALLGLGIGLNGAIFTLLDALLLRPLPVKKPAELVRLVQVSPNLGARSYFTYNAYRALLRSASVFTTVFGYQDMNVAVRDASGAHLVRCQIVTGNFFRRSALTRFMDALSRLTMNCTLARCPWS